VDNSVNTVDNVVTSTPPTAFSFAADGKAALYAHRPVQRIPSLYSGYSYKQDYGEKP
jgi:hypothetical protein